MIFYVIFFVKIKKTYALPEEEALSLPVQKRLIFIAIKKTIRIAKCIAAVEKLTASDMRFHDEQCYP